VGGTKKSPSAASTVDGLAIGVSWEKAGAAAGSSTVTASFGPAAISANKRAASGAKPSGLIWHSFGTSPRIIQELSKEMCLSAGGSRRAILIPFEPGSHCARSVLLTSKRDESLSLGEFELVA
jgi:hypothetical protein